MKQLNNRVVILATCVVGLLSIGSNSLAFGQENTTPEAADTEGTAQARLLFERGHVAYGQGDYETAIRVWQEAYAIDDRPLLQYNLSQAYERLGQPEDAASALDRYLETADPSDPNQATARARRAALRERLSHTGLRFMGGPAGARITVDGEAWGQLPRPDAVMVSPGAHQVLVRLDGYETFHSTVTNIAGQVLDIEVQMIEGESGGVGSSSSSGPGIAPWIVAGGGVALVGAAAVVGVLALGEASDAPSGQSSEADSARTLALTADILGAVGIAAIGAGVIWLVLGSGNDGDSDASVRITPVVNPQQAGIDARWSF